MIRPEQARIAPPGQGVRLTTLSRAFRGDHTLVIVRSGNGPPLELRLPGLQDAADTIEIAVEGHGVAFAPE